MQNYYSTVSGIMRLGKKCLSSVLTFHFPHSVWSEAETHGTFIKIFSTCSVQSAHFSSALEKYAIDKYVQEAYLWVTRETTVMFCSPEKNDSRTGNSKR